MYVPVCQYVGLCMYLSVSLSIYLSIYPSVCPTVYLSITFPDITKQQETVSIRYAYTIAQFEIAALPICYETTRKR